MNCISRTQLREGLKKALRAQRFAQAGLVEIYIQEAEHQEGPEYWDQFENAADLAADFDIFALNAPEDDDGNG